jgi:hypothetical protein
MESTPTLRAMSTLRAEAVMASMCRLLPNSFIEHMMSEPN